MLFPKPVSRPRRALRIALIFQLVAFAWELTWHLVLNPHAEGLGLAHVLTMHAPFNVALVLTVAAGAWLGLHSLRRSHLPVRTSIALAGITAEAIGWMWDLVAHAIRLHGHAPQLLMGAGVAIAVCGLVLQGQEGNRPSSNRPAPAETL